MKKILLLKTYLLLKTLVTHHKHVDYSFIIPLTEEDITDKDGNFTGKRKLRDSTAGLKALESLCKYLGFSSVSNDENSYQEAKIITISNLDDEKI